MILIGIDPGQRGAIVWRDVGGIDHAEIVMPNISEFSLYMRVLKSRFEKQVIHAFIEKAQSFPKQGISSAFNYGQHFGELLGVLMAFGIPHTLIAPGTWTRKMFVGAKPGSPKSKALEVARRLFPEINLVPEGCKKPHDGIVDALLIAEYGRRYIIQAS